jgi:hypothetical protein
VFHLEDFVGALLDDVGDGVSMGGPWQQAAQDQHVQRALEHVAACVGPGFSSHAPTIPEDYLVEKDEPAEGVFT